VDSHHIGVHMHAPDVWNVPEKPSRSHKKMRLIELADVFKSEPNLLN